MSDVGLPSAAWALEQQQQQQQQQRRSFMLSASARRGSACRNLFGPVDHQELRRELEGQLRAMREEGRRRWEYDFQSGRPLSPEGGRPCCFQWEEVDAQAVPAFYREALLLSGGGGGGERGGGSAPPSPLSPSRDESPGGEGEGEGETPKTEEEEEERLDRENRDASLRSSSSSSYSGILLKGPLKRAASPSLPRITDFFAKRKRVADSRVAVDPAATALPDSVAALPTEQTPRKRLR